MHEGATNTLTAKYNLEAEEAVIGSLLLDRDAVIKVASYLRPTDFHQEALGKVYGAIVGMYQRRVPADVVTIHAELQRLSIEGELHGHGFTGMAYLIGLIERCPTAAHLQYYAQMVVECAVRNSLITAGGRIAGEAYDEDAPVSDLLSRAQQALVSVYERSGSEGYTTLDEAMSDFLDRLDFLQNNQGVAMGVPTGFRDLDAMTGGLQPSDLVILAARPGVGKTSMLLNIARHAALTPRQDGTQRVVGIFSLEMSKQQLVNRLVSVQTGVGSQKLREGGLLSDNELGLVMTSVGDYSAMKVLIDDRTNLRISELKARANRMKADHGIDILMVDYLQLVHGEARKDPNRVQEVGDVARGLKELAKELNVPVVAACQLNRALEGRADKVPQLSDLRESGEIEQAADIVMFIHREDIFGAATDRPTEANLYIKKHRSGPMGMVNLMFNPQTTAFSNPSYRKETNHE